MRGFLVLALMAISASAWANLPLTVEELLTDKGKYKLDASVAYANSDRQGISTGTPLLVQTGPTSFISLPTTIGESIGNSDTWVATLGLRYGLTARAELYGRVSGLSSTQRSAGLSGTSTNSESRFAEAWAGLNYQFKGDDASPALLGFAEIALRERHRESSANLKSVMLGLTSYHAIDPVVFSITAGYRLNQSRQDGAQAYRPGNLLLLHPSVAFAVNDRVTLTTGLQWTRRAADLRTGQPLGIARTATDLLMGVGYGFDKGNTFNITFKVNASGRNGAEMRLSWLRTL